MEVIHLYFPVNDTAVRSALSQHEKILAAPIVERSRLEGVGELAQAILPLTPLAGYVLGRVIALLEQRHESFVVRSADGDVLEAKGRAAGKLMALLAASSKAADDGDS